MEMEHINENLIKVVIDAEDLEARGITFLDLVSGQDYIEEFFYSILEEIDVTEHFRDSDAVTFQVMPKQDGIELYISRQDFNEEGQPWEDELTKHLIEHHRMMQSRSKERSESTESKSSRSSMSTESKTVEEQKSNDKDEIHKDFIIRFNDLNALIAMTKSVHSIYDISSDLYHMQGNYYLVVHSSQVSISKTLLKHFIFKALEFGVLYRRSEDYLIEHAELIRELDTIDYFSNNF